nr:putative protein TPRXL [Nicotiana tomentosiformis]
MSFPTFFDVVASNEPVIASNDSVTSVSTNDSSPNSSYTRSSYSTDPASPSRFLPSVHSSSTSPLDTSAPSPSCSSPSLKSPPVLHSFEPTEGTQNSYLSKRLSPNSQALVSSICNDSEPSSFEEVVVSLLAKHPWSRNLRHSMPTTPEI